MSEQILNQGSMYESIQGIQELNQVEGLIPENICANWPEMDRV